MFHVKHQSSCMLTARRFHVKHLDDKNRSDLIRWTDELELKVDLADLDRVLRHVDWVLEQNKTLNLTAIKDPAEAVRLHALDSLTILPELSDSPDGSLLDMGTGAGFPGIPAMLVTGRPVTLVDSVGKKVKAISDFTTASGWGSLVEVSSDRLEDLGRVRRSQFAVVTARALAPLPSLVELAAPFLTDGGHLICMKGTPDPQELTSGDKVGGIVGMRRVSTRALVLPEGNETRTIVTYVRAGKSKIGLPRRVGLAQKKPLA